MNIQQLREQIAALQDATMDENRNFRSDYDEGKFDALSAVDNLLDSLQEEPVSEELEEACKKLTENARKHKAETSSPFFSPTDYKQGVMDGTKWQKKQFEKDCADLCNGIATAKGIAVAMTYDKGMADAREQMMKNIWKPADGDDLPEIDRGVIVLTQPYPLGGNEYVVSFAQRPNLNGWDGKSVITGKTVHYMPKTYDKGGWNIPNVKYWLDCQIPNMEED